MKVAVVADAHIGGPGGEARPLVEQLLRLPAEGASRLVLLGDIFQAWVGFEQYETPGVRLFLDSIAEIRRGGVRVDYVEGNRDFFLADGPYAASFDTIAGECAFVANGVRYLAVHGDGLNDRDRSYLAWRWASKSWPVRTVIRTLPRRIVGRFVDATESRLSQTNFKHRAEIPEAAIRAFGEKRLAEGHDVLLLGHFHEPHVLCVAGGEVRLLDAWFRSRRVEWLG
ncbi:MAG: UDP-2,3-diacylglucosamine diphosphatase [Thermoanaerobaculia bacterium]